MRTYLTSRSSITSKRLRLWHTPRLVLHVVVQAARPIISFQYIPVIKVGFPAFCTLEEKDRTAYSIFAYGRKASTPSLLIWLFDSRGGMSPGPNSVALPDWVDENVADWIASESSSMEGAWGNLEQSGLQSLVFSHIPP